MKTKDGIRGPEIEYSRFYAEGRAATTGCWGLQGLRDASDDTEEDNNHVKLRLLKRKCDYAAPPPYETELSAPRIELGLEDLITGNCRRQETPTYSLARDAHATTHATDVSFEYAYTSEINDCLLGYVTRSSPPIAHAIAGKTEPSSVHATSPVYEEARLTACERQSSHRCKCISATARDTVSSAAPFVFSNTCVSASACVTSTPDAH